MLYAAYGSNLHPARLTARTPSATLLGTATLSGWAIKFHERSRDGSSKANIEQAGGVTFLAVYDIPEPELNRLHVIEGAGYGVETLEVPDFGACAIYIAAETHIDDSLSPYSWYKSLVLMGCRHFEFPSDYVARIDAVGARLDPDIERHELHMKLVAKAIDPKDSTWQR